MDELKFLKCLSKLPDEDQEDLIVKALSKGLISLPEEKHLPGGHDQETHSGSKTLGTRVLAPPVLSSMSKDLKGKMLRGKTIVQVLKAKDKSVRIVEFGDGTQKLVPSPILGKLAYGPGSGSEIGKLFKSVQSLRKNGFVSYAQAAYLYNEDRKNFYLIMGKARAGKRMWNEEEGRMMDPEGDPEYKHLPGQHDQDTHGRDFKSIKDKIKRYTPAVMAGLSAGAAALGVMATVAGALATAGKITHAKELEDEVIRGFKGDIDAKLGAANDMRAQSEAATDRMLKVGLWAKAAELEAEYHEIKHMKDWPRKKILDHLRAKYGVKR